MAERRGVRPSTTSWWRRSRLKLLLLLGVACSGKEAPTAPRYTFLSVRARTSGGDLDLDGYRAVVDGEERDLLGGTSPASVLVQPGVHSVALNGVAKNCTVGGAAVRSVTAEEGTIVDVTFDVVCVATGLTVTMSTEGPDTPDSFSVLVGGQTYSIAKIDRLDVGRLAPGSYAVELVMPENCTVSGGPPAAVDVVAGTVAVVPAFHVACTPAVRYPRIAYVSTDTENGNGRGYIESIRLDGSARMQLTAGDAPAWSPDGTKLIFSIGSCTPWDYDVCVGGLALVDPEVGNRTDLNAAKTGFRPAWAPTGDAIAYELRGYADGPAQVVLMRTSDSSVVQLSVKGPIPYPLERPTWSPDGARLAATCTWLHSDLCLVNRDGSGIVRLTDDAIEDRDPAWSPDGKTIAFARRGADPSDRTSSDVALFDLATGVITILTKGTDPAWSPDGSKLAFAGSDGIFIINADGTNRTRLTSGSHSAPAWRP
ncbi:MAG: hypothetical protein DMD35_11965 [Gemmatimonadetes bacterium]|nr:MAG: hypothetical protein DMD35_11965 [Gemmatimonadota bacterium]